MNNYSSAAKQYGSIDLQSKTEAANPHQLIQMLIDGAINRIKTAIVHMERNDIAKKGEMIGKAIAIIDGLRSSLDMDKGKEISGNLDELYFYMGKRLLEANAQNNPEYLKEVCSLLEEIKSAWDSIADKPEAQNISNNTMQTAASMP